MKWEMTYKRERRLKILTESSIFFISVGLVVGVNPELTSCKLRPSVILDSENVLRG